MILSRCPTFKPVNTRARNTDARPHKKKTRFTHNLIKQTTSFPFRDPTISYTSPLSPFSFSYLLFKPFEILAVWRRLRRQSFHVLNPQFFYEGLQESAWFFNPDATFRALPSFAFPVYLLPPSVHTRNIRYTKHTHKHTAPCLLLLFPSLNLRSFFREFMTYFLLPLFFYGFTLVISSIANKSFSIYILFCSDFDSLCFGVRCASAIGRRAVVENCNSNMHTHKNKFPYIQPVLLLSLSRFFLSLLFIFFSFSFSSVR